MILYVFTGVVADANGEVGWFVPGISVGAFFSGTMSLEPNTPGPTAKAILHLMVGGHAVNATSVGLDPLKSFADHVPTGPLSSPTVQHGGYIDNAFFKVEVSGRSLGTTGFTVQGPGPGGTSKAAAVSGAIRSLVVV